MFALALRIPRIEVPSGPATTMNEWRDESPMAEKIVPLLASIDGNQQIVSAAGTDWSMPNII